MGAVFVHEGQAIDHTPAADLAAGEVVVQGELVGVTRLDIKAGDLGALAVTGVFDFPKQVGAAVTFATGDNAYWDDANNVAVSTDGAGANALLGKAVADAADIDEIVRVRLSQ